jgi:hypothetical protein
MTGQAGFHGILIAFGSTVVVVAAVMFERILQDAIAVKPETT